MMLVVSYSTVSWRAIRLLQENMGIWSQETFSQRQGAVPPTSQYIFPATLGSISCQGPMITLSWSGTVLVGTGAPSGQVLYPFALRRSKDISPLDPSMTVVNVFP